MQNLCCCLPKRPNTCPDGFYIHICSHLCTYVTCLCTYLRECKVHAFITFWNGMLGLVIGAQGVRRSCSPHSSMDQRLFFVSVSWHVTHWDSVSMLKIFIHFAVTSSRRMARLFCPPLVWYQQSVMRQSSSPQAIHFSAASGKCVNQVCQLKALTYYKSRSIWSDLLGKLQIHLICDSNQSAESFSPPPPHPNVARRPECLPDVYIFGLGCLYLGTDKQCLIGRPFLAGFRAGGCDAEGKGEVEDVSLSLPQEKWPDGPTNPAPTPFPPTEVFPWWECWQRLVGNWKLQSTENNYPKQAFFSDYTIASNMCPCFWNILSSCHLSCLSLL